MFVLDSVIRNTRVRKILSALFQAVQTRVGLSVTPSHFYFPVPSLKSLEEKDWMACRPCRAFDLRLQDQIRRLDQELLPFAAEWTFAETSAGDKQGFHFENGFFECVDAEVAYSFVRHRKPSRIIEIGSGHTTLLLAAALGRNKIAGSPGELISINPHPAPFLRSAICDAGQLIERPVQQVPLDLFRTLRADDILFIDSSHVVSMDNDVLYECLCILPELAPGVLVHFHDVFTPLDYPEKFVKKNLCFWGEQYLLEAFLSFNTEFKVVWSASAMQQHRPDILQRVFPSWEGSFARMPEKLKAFVPTLDGKNVWPCSFWIARI